MKFVEEVDSPSAYLGQFYVNLAPEAAGTVPIIVSWLHGERGRKVKLGISDSEMEPDISSAEEVESSWRSLKSSVEAESKDIIP